MENKLTLSSHRRLARYGSGASKMSALLAGVLFTSGCLQQSVDSGSGVTLSGFPSSVSATPGSPAVINGKVESGSALDSVVIEVLDGNGASADRVRVLGGGKTSYAVNNQTFSFTSASCNGNYKARVTGYAGTTSKSVDIAITLSGAKDCSIPQGTPLTVTPSLSLGAQSNATLGSSIDLDGPTVMLSAAARTNAGTVDLIYMWDFATGTEKFGSPSWAKDNVDFMTGWSVYNTTRFERAPSGTVFANVATTEQLAALWKSSSATTTSLDAGSDDLFIAQTDKGKLVLIEITSQVLLETGSINIKVGK